MNQDTRPAPFNLGDHVRYVGAQKHLLPGKGGSQAELVLAPGMEGVILLSTGDLSRHGEGASKPWHCQVQFKNGFRLDISPDNCADFEMALVESPVS